MDSSFKCLEVWVRVRRQNGYWTLLPTDSIKNALLFKTKLSRIFKFTFLIETMGSSFKCLEFLMTMGYQLWVINYCLLTNGYRLLVTDLWLATIGYPLLLIDYCLLTIAYRLVVFDYVLTPIGYRLLAIDYWLSTIRYRLLAIDYRLSTIALKGQDRARYRLLVIDCWLSATTTYYSLLILSLNSQGRCFMILDSPTCALLLTTTRSQLVLKQRQWAAYFTEQR